METKELTERLIALEADHAVVKKTVNESLSRALDQWDLAQFNQGEIDLRWAKEQTTAVARNSAVLSGAILTASKLIDVDRAWFVGVLILQVAIAIYWEVKLHYFAKEVRERVDKLLKAVEKRSQAQTLDHHVILAVALCALIALAAITAILAPLLPRATP